MVIKPINEGSSLGVKISKNLVQLVSFAKNLFQNVDQLIFEQFIEDKKYRSQLLTKLH